MGLVNILITSEFIWKSKSFTDPQSKKSKVILNRIFCVKATQDYIKFMEGPGIILFPCDQAQLSGYLFPVGAFASASPMQWRQLNIRQFQYPPFLNTNGVSKWDPV